FLESSFPPKNADLIQQADMFKNQFACLLTEAVRMTDGILSPEFLRSGEVVTDLTLEAERLTEFYTCVPLFTEITQMELSIGGGGDPPLATMVDMVNRLNQQAIVAVRGLIDYKVVLLNDVLSCRVFTFNYPLLIDHILREARLYLSMLEQLQNRVEIDMVAEAIQQEAFWSRIMAEHAKFIRGLLDPTEVQLFNTADSFGKQFDILTAQAEALSQDPMMLPAVTEETRRATISIRDFKKQGTEGLIECKIRSIIIPLLGDHVSREANHFLRLLNIFESGMNRC
ncbi:MAG TPA: DUF2935 domain-containing protein, partial [Bacillota bacterium]|nr:DUF2935 domain-containing protein [Bacillota bacterium]